MFSFKKKETCIINLNNIYSKANESKNQTNIVDIKTQIANCTPLSSLSRH